MQSPGLWRRPCAEKRGQTTRPSLQGERHSPLHEGFAPESLASLVAGFKSATTKRADEIRHSQGPLWQRNYYEHIIRNEDNLYRIRRYILDNPAKWDEDSENPSNP